MNGPQDVLEAIKEGRISHPNVGRDVAKLADKPRATVLASDDIVAALRKHQASQERKGKTKKPSRGGRPATRAKLGTTKNMAVMEHMVKKIDPDNNYADVNWDDPKQVSQVWKDLLKRLEAELG